MATKKRLTILGIIAVVLAIAALPSRAEMLDSWDDLDLGGNIVKAINFCRSTNAGSRLVNGVTFTGVYPGATVDPDVVTNANASYNIGGGGYYPTMTSMLHGVIYNSAYDVTVPALPDGRYKVQMLFYDAWAGAGVRDTDITIEGTTIYPGYDYYVEQGSTKVCGGSMVTCVVDVTGGLDIDLSKITNTPHLNALVVSTAAGESTGYAKERLYDAAQIQLDAAKVVKAIDFSSSTTQPDRKLNGVTFLKSLHNTTVDGVTNTATGSVYSGTYPTFDLEQVSGSLIAVTDGGNMDIDVALESGYYYQVQLIMTELWGSGNPSGLHRQVDISLEGTLVADNYDYGVEQGGAYASSIITTTVAITDGNLDILLDPETYDALVSGMVITKGALVPEPSAIALIVCGLLSLIACRRR